MQSNHQPSSFKPLIQLFVNRTALVYQQMAIINIMQISGVGPAEHVLGFPRVYMSKVELPNMREYEREYQQHKNPEKQQKSSKRLKNHSKILLQEQGHSPKHHSQYKPFNSIQYNQNESQYQKYIGKYFHHQRNFSTVDEDLKYKFLKRSKSKAKSLKKYGTELYNQHNTSLLKMLQQKTRLMKVTGKKNINRQDNLIILTKQQQISDKKAINVSKFLNKQRDALKQKIQHNKSQQMMMIDLNMIQQEQIINSRSESFYQAKTSRQSFKIINKTILIEPHNYYSNDKKKYATPQHQFQLTANKAFIGAKKSAKKLQKKRPQIQMPSLEISQEQVEEKKVKEQRKNTLYDLIAKYEHKKKGWKQMGNKKSEEMKPRVLPDIRGWDIDEEYPILNR